MLKFMVSFICFAILCVLLFAASGPMTSALTPPVRKLTQQTHTFKASSHKAPPPILQQPPPPLSSPPPPPPSAAKVRAVDAKGAEDPGGAARVTESSPLIQGMIEAGFSRDQSARALKAIGAKELVDVPKAITWALKQGTDKNLAEYDAEREAHSWDMMDFDGYALLW